MTVVVGVDGSGRTHRLRMLAAAATGPVAWFTAPPVPDVRLVLVDDAHRLDPSALRILAAACRAGTPMVIARRPTVTGPELAELDEAASSDAVEFLTPLDRDAVSRLIATATGRPVPPEVADALFEASAGLPAIAAALAAGLGADLAAGSVAGPVTGPVAGPVTGPVAGPVTGPVAGPVTGPGIGRAAMPVVGRATGFSAGRDTGTGGVPPVLLARVQRRFAVLDQAAVAVARVLALRLDLADQVVAAACGVDVSALATIVRTLHDEGLLVPGGDRMIPAVAQAVLAELSAAERRRIHDALAGSMIASGADPVTAAGQLRAARVTTPAAAAVYREAAERLRFSDPTAALGWYEDAAESGGDPAGLAAGRAESSALLGLPVDLDEWTRSAHVTPAPAAGRLALVAGVAAAHDGRAARAAELLLAAPVPGPTLAIPFLIGIGRPTDPTAAAPRPGSGAVAVWPEPGSGAVAVWPEPGSGAAAASPEPAPEVAASPRPGTGATAAVRPVAGGPVRAPGGLVRFAEAAQAAGDPDVALPLFIEAAEAMERGSPQVVLPDTPHAIGAVVAVAAGDVASAEHLLARARAAGVGGPAADGRHRLLLAWARMRAGRYETALDELRRPAGDLSGRDRMLRAAVAAGIARRRGDIAGLRDAWAGVEPLLARRAVDLWQLEAVEELAVAAARLRRLHRVTPILELLDRAVAGLGRPPAWQTALDWIHLQTAVAADDPTAAAEVAARLAWGVTGSDARPAWGVTGSDARPARGVTGSDAHLAWGAAGNGSRPATVSAGMGAALGAGAEAGTGADRPRAQAVAARCWAEVLAGTVDPDAVLAATEDLQAAELPWEASRLAGQAAIRTTDGSTARRLLERARELSEPETDGPGGGGLSDREVTVARLVLAGSTHREIGAQLFISPKTVEHHVARIRAKLGANTRAELLAMLRELLDA